MAKTNHLIIDHVEVYALNIPMKPFVISLGTLYEAKNILVKIFTKEGIIGWGEGSPFPMITGETQGTALALAKDFAALLKGKNALDITGCMTVLDRSVAGNPTAKSAFDMALYDIAAKRENVPLYKYLGGQKKTLITDHTVSIASAEDMASTALELKKKGAVIIKVKLGNPKNAKEDIERVKAIRKAIGNDIPLRLDANQGWSVPMAIEILHGVENDHVQFCEQPVKHYDYEGLKIVNDGVKIPVMADESCYYAYQADYIIKKETCPLINIKLAKSGGILEALKIANLTKEHNLTCMLGGMIESRLALTANAHLASAFDHIKYYDLDYCFNHTIDPIVDGVEIRNAHEIHLPELPGIGATVDEGFLKKCEHWAI